MKVCVQIGLCESLEGMYLVYPSDNFVNNTKYRYANNMEVVRSLLDDLKGDDWYYWGVDSDIASVFYLVQEYGGYLRNERCHLLLASVGGETKISQGDLFWSMPTHSGRFKYLNPPFYNGSVLRPELSLKDLFFYLGLPSVDLLILDCEGSEYEIFENYDFSVKPKCIVVECHPRTDSRFIRPIGKDSEADEMNKLLSGNGYRHIRNLESIYKEMVFEYRND